RIVGEREQCQLSTVVAAGGGSTCCRWGKKAWSEPSTLLLGPVLASSLRARFVYSPDPGWVNYVASLARRAATTRTLPQTIVPNLLCEVRRAWARPCSLAVCWRCSHPTLALPRPSPHLYLPAPFIAV